MPRVCTICTHKAREDIDKALLEGEPYRHIATRYGTSTGSLQRHKEHIPTALIKAQEAQEVVYADSLLAQIAELRDKALIILTRAERAGDLRTALQGVREARGCLELLAKLQGELTQEGTVNVIISPQWLSLRTVILQALEPYPGAKLALAEALGHAE